MELVRLRAFAKVNYALEVLGLRDDGYHEIRTVMQSVSLADEIEIERAEEDFELHVEPAATDVGPPEENTVRKAWLALREVYGADLKVRIRLHKKIPPGAGLGGGSADAAATLHGINELFSLGLNYDELRGVGSHIGADVPFCMVGGTALGEGVGDLLTPLPAPPAHRLVVVKPERGAQTAEIYRAYDDARPRRGVASVEPVVAALWSGDLPMLAGAVGNDLEAITGELVPEVEAYKEELLRGGALGAAMSGTGTAVYGIFSGDEVGKQPHAPFRFACELREVGIEIV